MTPDQAKTTIVFLERITLRPAEINAFAEIVNALNVIISPPGKEEKASE